ncbi:MAG: flagellar assembly protein A [Bacillota bacterium]
MKDMVVQATTVRKAIKKAVLLFGVPENKLEIEIIDKGTHRVLGFGGRLATIKASRKEDLFLAQRPEIEPVEDDNPPTVAVTGGQVVVNHGEEGPYPTISTAKGVNLWVNDQLIHEEVVITKYDKVRLEFQNERREGSWEIKVSQDEMEAALMVKPTIVIERHLKDQPPRRYLQLQVEESASTVPVYTFEQVFKEINARGIKHGLDWAAVNQPIESDRELNLVIARGTPPVKAKDPRLEVKFALQKRVHLQPMEEVSVDYHERFVFTSVEAGAVLAILRPGVEGTPGMTVTGQIVYPEPPREILLKAGKGVMLLENGKQAIATKSGRPVITQMDKEIMLQMLDVLVVPGDVDLLTGNVRFKGDLLLLGNVREGMVAESWGEMRIGGDVYHANVQSMSSVMVRGNAVTSVVTAGVAGMHDLLPVLEDIAGQIKGIALAIEQLSKNPAFKTADLKDNLGPIVQILLEAKFKGLPNQVEVLAGLLKSIKVESWSERLKEFSQELVSIFRNKPLSITTNQLITLQLTAQELLEDYMSLPQQPGDLEVSYAINSVLKASGHVVVRGQGCFNTQITAGGNVNVSRLFRGGEIIAAGDVHVGELGSPAGSITRIIAAPKARVSLGKAWGNSVVQVGHRRHHFDDAGEHLVLRLDKHGNLQVLDSYMYDLSTNGEQLTVTSR